MKHESGRMNFIQEKDTSINILSGMAAETMIPIMNAGTPPGLWILSTEEQENMQPTVCET